MATRIPTRHDFKKGLIPFHECTVLTTRLPENADTIPSSSPFQKVHFVGFAFPHVWL